MSLYVSNFIEHIEELQNRDFETIFKKSPFRVLFFDTTKIRIRLADRDISVPISILLLSIARLLSHKKIDRWTCESLIGKDWGYQYIARLLLECDDVKLDPESRDYGLLRIPKKKPKVQFQPPERATVAVNPNGNGCSQ